MPVPKRKKSHSRTAMHKSHWKAALKAPVVNTCPNCGAPKQAHRACPSCGHYRGREVLAITPGTN